MRLTTCYATISRTLNPPPNGETQSHTSMFTLTGSLSSIRQSAPLLLTTVQFLEHFSTQRNFLEFKCPQESPGDFFRRPNTNYSLPQSQYNAVGARDTSCRAGMISSVQPNLIGQRRHAEGKGAQYANDVIKAFPIGLQFTVLFLFPHLLTMNRKVT